MGDKYFISATYSIGRLEQRFVWGVGEIDETTTDPMELAKLMIHAIDDVTDLDDSTIHITAFNRVYCYDEPKQGFFSRIINKLKGG